MMTSSGGSVRSGMGNDVAAEAQVISEATQVATVAARSVLASGGSQATALKTAKAAAKSTLLGKGKMRMSDDISVNSRASTGTAGWGHRRKMKRQAEIVSSMALGAAMNSFQQEQPHTQFSPVSFRPQTILDAHEEEPSMPRSNSSAATRSHRPPLSPNSSARNMGSNSYSNHMPGPPMSPVSSTRNLSYPSSVVMPDMPPMATVTSYNGSVRTRTQSSVRSKAASREAMSMHAEANAQSLHSKSQSKKSNISNPNLRKKNAPIVKEDERYLKSTSTISTDSSKQTATGKLKKSISAVDFNSEDPIYWDNEGKKQEMNLTEDNQHSPAHASVKSGQSSNDGPSTHTGESTENTKEGIVFDDASEFSDDDVSFDDDSLLERMEDDGDDRTVVERSLSPFFQGIESMFGCTSCSSKQEVPKVEKEAPKPVRIEIPKEEVSTKTDKESKKKVPVTPKERIEVAKTTEAREVQEEPITTEVEEKRVDKPEGKVEDVYHTIVLKSRYEPEKTEPAESEKSVDVDGLVVKEAAKSKEQAKKIPKQERRQKKSKLFGKKKRNLPPKNF